MSIPSDASLSQAYLITIPNKQPVTKSSSLPPLISSFFPAPSISSSQNLEQVSDDEDDNSGNTGRWSKEEHARFKEALELYGKDWKSVKNYVGTRSTTQARSHAQKYFSKLEKKSECCLMPSGIEMKACLSNSTLESENGENSAKTTPQSSPLKKRDRKKRTLKSASKADVKMSVAIAECIGPELKLKKLDLDSALPEPPNTEGWSTAPPSAIAPLCLIPDDSFPLFETPAAPLQTILPNPAPEISFENITFALPKEEPLEMFEKQHANYTKMRESETKPHFCVIDWDSVLTIGKKH